MQKPEAWAENSLMDACRGSSINSFCVYPFVLTSMFTTSQKSIASLVQKTNSGEREKDANQAKVVMMMVGIDVVVLRVRTCEQ